MYPRNTSNDKNTNDNLITKKYIEESLSVAVNLSNIYSNLSIEERNLFNIYQLHFLKTDNLEGIGLKNFQELLGYMRNNPEVSVFSLDKILNISNKMTN